MWPYLAAAGVLLLYFVWWAFRKSRLAKDAEDPPDAIVLLLAKPTPLNVQYLSIVASRALGREMPAVDNAIAPDPDEDPEAPDAVMGATPHFMLFVDRKVYMMHAVAAPYVDPEEFKDAYRELRSKAALASHTAWLSVDFLAGSATAAERRVMARLVAEFVGPDCLALYHPGTERLIPMSSETRDELVDTLRGDGDPVAELFEAGASPFAPVMPVDDDDPRLVEAIGEARRRFPEFEAAFRGGGANAEFGIKARLESGGNVEHIWVDVKQIEGTRVIGVLGNEPVDLEGYRLGSRVVVDTSDIEDWGILRGEADQPLGLFMIAALQQIEAARDPRK